MEKAVFFGILDEISMKAQILRDRLKDNPEAVDEIIAHICRLEDDLVGAIGCFYGSGPT